MRFLPLLLLAAAPLLAADPVPEFKGSIERLDPALDALLAKDAKIEVLASGFTWSEGPVWFQNSMVFSDVPKNIAYQWKEGDKAAAIFLQPSGATQVLSDQGSNGLAHDAKGQLYLCQGGDRCVARLEKDGKFTRLATSYQGKHFNSPNDLVITRNGMIYFTDPPYGVPEGGKEELGFHGVFGLSQQGTLNVLIRDVKFPNGLAFSPDEKTLYIAASDPDAPRILAFPFHDGVVGKSRVFFNAKPLLTPERQGLPDGLKVDASGNVWTTGPDGVQIVSPEGKLVGTIHTGLLTGNCAFGGDGSDLYITASMFLLRVKTKVKGDGF